LDSIRAAGTFLFLASLQFIIATIIAETQFPSYSTKTNVLSDLASTVPPRTYIVQPAATIWNSTVIVFGLLISISSYFMHRAFQKLYLTILLAITGAAAIAVGIFPGDTGILHIIVAVLTFSLGGITAIAYCKIEEPPLNYISVIIGIWVLVSLGMAISLGSDNPLKITLGRGGGERMTFYPLVLWIVCFGGYLMASRSNEIK